MLNKIVTMMFLKSYRKEFYIYSSFCLEPVLKEIGRRFGLSLAEARYLTRQEIEKYLNDISLYTKKIKKQIKARFYKGCVSVIKGSQVKILNIEEGKKYLKFIKKTL